MPEHVFRLIVEAIDDSLVLFDSERRIRYANPGFCELLQVSLPDISGKRLFDVIKPLEGPETNQMRHDILKCRRCSYHGIFFKSLHSGRRIGPFCVSCIDIREADFSDGILILKDMTQVSEYIEQIEEVGRVLEKERNYLNEILDGIADGYYVTNCDRQIIRVNHKLLELLGKKEEEVLGMSCQDVLASGKCGHDCPLTWVHEHFKPILNAVETIQGRDGERIPVRKSTFPVMGLDNKLSGAICIIHNRTEVETLKNKLSVHGLDFPLISNNKRMQEIFSLILSMKDTDPFVLLTGESGTGKEVIANAIVVNSPRKDKPYLKINCSALPEGLLESELFGHKRGAFTGAIADKMGKFAMAHGGTILLDEIGNMPFRLQAKVLRLLENGEFQPVGSTKTEKVDVRIIAATNQDLQKQIRNGMFREDLFYRLCVVPIELPPLRKRKEDIPFFIRHFIDAFNRRYGRGIKDVSARAFSMLMEYDWPGNIRELRNAIEHAFACTSGEVIERAHLPLNIRRAVMVTETELLHHENGDDVTREMIIEMLRRYKGNRAQTARALRISRTTLWRRMKSLKIEQYS